MRSTRARRWTHRGLFTDTHQPAPELPDTPRTRTRLPQAASSTRRSTTAAAGLLRKTSDSCSLSRSTAPCAGLALHSTCPERPETNALRDGTRRLTRQLSRASGLMLRMSSWSRWSSRRVRSGRRSLTSFPDVPESSVATATRLASTQTFAPESGHLKKSKLLSKLTSVSVTVGLLSKSFSRTAAGTPSSGRSRALQSKPLPSSKFPFFAAHEELFFLFTRILKCDWAQISLSVST
mmetsp:Transcript_5020/g.10429  ORF Transcript_5020/g.10429 Transcript_5020/m.10429 type:complete len:236 (+) Transcript_5020:1597-2304(+)